jgi:hypothetical protein
MSPTTIDDPEHWHDRAEEMRALAELMKGLDTHRKMLQLAADYDKLGDRAAERQAKPQGAKCPAPGA